MLTTSDRLEHWWSETVATLCGLSPSLPCAVVVPGPEMPPGDMPPDFSVHVAVVPDMPVRSAAFLTSPEDVPLSAIFPHPLRPIRHVYFRSGGNWKRYSALACLGSKLSHSLLYRLEWSGRQKPLCAAGRLANGFIALLDAIVPTVFAPRWLDVILAQIATGPRRKDRLDRIVGSILDRLPGKKPGRGVAFVLPSLSAGGAERQAVQLAIGMAGQGWGVRFLAKHLDSAKGQDFHLERLRQSGIACDKPLDRGFALADLPLIDEISARIVDLPPNLRRLTGQLYANFRRSPPQAVIAWMDEMMAAAGIAAILAGVPFAVLSARNLRPAHFETIELAPIAAALRGLARLPGIILANNSRAGAEDYAAWLGQRSDAIAVIRNGFEAVNFKADAATTAVLRRRYLGEGRRLVGGVFRFSEEKHPMLWLHCAANLMRSDPGLRFVLFGDGPLRAAMEALARRLGLEGRLHMPGRQRDIAAAMQACDSLLLTSVVEGTPNMLLEAQWLGIPCVARLVGGVAEAAPEDGLVLMTVDGEPDALASLVRRQLQWHAKELAQRQTASSAFIASEFDPRKALERHIGMLGGMP